MSRHKDIRTSESVEFPRVSQAVEILDKGDCMATPLCSMIVPLIPMHSNTVIRGEAFVLAGGDEFL